MTLCALAFFAQAAKDVLQAFPTAARLHWLATPDRLALGAIVIGILTLIDVAVGIRLMRRRRSGFIAALILAVLTGLAFDRIDVTSVIYAVLALAVMALLVRDRKWFWAEGAGRQP